MKKKSKILIASCAVFLMMSGAVLAKSPDVRIFINNIEFDGSALKLNVVKGTSMVSLRSIVDQFNGEVTYKDKSIFITTPESSNVAMQVNSLENALIAATPEDAVQTWIKGVQSRSGAMQYAVLSPELRQQTKQQFEDHFWVTGGSSPRMGKVEKLQSKEVTADKIEISFEYPLITMTETIDTGNATITVERIDRESSDYWAISKIVMKDPDDTGTMIGADMDDSSDENKENHFTPTLP
ncbi:MAG TPA: hypothetical protein IAA29_18815 [Candidatus Paenibacillus intestinavium]|nr:hypothetical protein [Candidatus Paenibacillus intestinavium]